MIIINLSPLIPAMKQSDLVRKEIYLYFFTQFSMYGTYSFVYCHIFSNLFFFPFPALKTKWKAIYFWREWKSLFHISHNFLIGSYVLLLVFYMFTILLYIAGPILVFSQLKIGYIFNIQKKKEFWKVEALYRLFLTKSSAPST